MTLKRREFLMLAHTYKPKKHGIAGWFMSDKLDGQRALWDGGISRGMPKNQVPWANTSKDDRYKEEQISTGLWSRYGNVIHAPDWWLDELPAIMLDGELWHGELGDGKRQDLRRIISTLVGGFGWKRVKFYVFDLPNRNSVFMDGRLSSPNFTTNFEGITKWADDKQLTYEPVLFTQFDEIVRAMKESLTGDVAIPHVQTRLPWSTPVAVEQVYARLDEYTDQGGEGLILRKPESSWTPKRMHELLKVKKLGDDEGTVVGYVTGRETDKGSKLLGLMGALILNYEGKRLELSGFTDVERCLGFAAGHEYEHTTPEEWAEENPGQEVPEWVSAIEFPRGSKITFRYRGKSLDGIPTEARYWRKRDVV